MTLPFLGGGGGGGGEQEIWAFAPPTPNARQSLTFHQKPEFQTFLKMRWRLLPSPASAPSLLSPFPPPHRPPPPRSQAFSSGQGGPTRLGGDPKYILPLTVMLQKLKTHLWAGRPPSVSSQKVAEEALNLSFLPRVKDAWKPSAQSPLGWSWTLGAGRGGAVAVTPSLPTKPTLQSQGSLNTLQNPSDGASPDSHL